MTLDNGEVARLLDELAPRYLPLLGDASADGVASLTRGGEWFEAVENLLLGLSRREVPVLERDVTTLTRLAEYLGIEMPPLQSATA